MEVELAPFVNRHLGSPAVIVGSSPSLKKFCFDAYKGIIIGVGDSPLRCINLFQTDYWVIANSYWPRPWCSRDAAALNDVRPLAAFVALTMFAYQNPADVPTMTRLIRKNLKVPLIGFRATRDLSDELGVPQWNSTDKESDAISPQPIQDLVAELANTEEKYSSGSSSAVHALALALIMGCSPIYITGVDLPYWLHDYKYYSPHGWRNTIRRYGSLGPFCDDFTDPRFKSKFRVSGPIWHDAEMIRSRLFSVLGKPRRSDFGNHMVSLVSDFEYLAGVAADRAEKTDVFVNGSESALSEISGIVHKSCHCGDAHR